jgi:hypothetical protein
MIYTITFAILVLIVVTGAAMAIHEAGRHMGE